MNFQKRLKVRYGNGHKSTEQDFKIQRLNFPTESLRDNIVLLNSAGVTVWTVREKNLLTGGNIYFRYAALNFRKNCSIWSIHRDKDTSHKYAKE